MKLKRPLEPRRGGTVCMRIVFALGLAVTLLGARVQTVVEVFRRHGNCTNHCTTITTTVTDAGSH